MTSDDTQLPNSPGPEVTPVSWSVLVVVGLYTLALLGLGASLALAGLAVIILGVWTYIYADRLGPFRYLVAIVGLGFLVLCGVWDIGLVFEPLRPLPPAKRTQCRNNLKQIGFALDAYHDEHGSFPPAVTYDEDGRPMHSWRVLLLPYMDHERLFEEYDLSQPWDSPQNLQLTDRMPPVYRCPSHRSSDEEQNNSSYVAVVDEQTCWPPDDTRSRDQIADGRRSTVLIVECDALDTPWSQPVDLSLDEAVRLVTIEDPWLASGHRSETREYVAHPGRNVLLDDGVVQFVSWNAPADAWEAALTVDDGRTAEELLAIEPPHANHAAKVGHSIVAWTFLLLCGMPLVFAVWDRVHRC